MSSDFERPSLEKHGSTFKDLGRGDGLAEQVPIVFSLNRILFVGVACDCVPVMNERVSLEEPVMKGDTGDISTECGVPGREGAALKYCHKRHS